MNFLQELPLVGLSPMGIKLIWELSKGIGGVCSPYLNAKAEAYKIIKY